MKQHISKKFSKKPRVKFLALVKATFRFVLCSVDVSTR